MFPAIRRLTRPALVLLVPTLALTTMWTTSSARTNDPFAVPNDLPQETFDNGKPDGWTVVNNGPGTEGGWVFDNPIGQPNGTKGTGPFAMSYQSKTDNSPTKRIDSVLTTPVLDLSAATDVTLKFSVYFNMIFQDTLSIDVTTDGGGNWVSVWTPNPLRVGDWSLPLTGQLAGQSSVQFRFVHKTHWTYLGPHIFQIDNVEVVAIGTPSAPTNARATANGEQVAVDVAWDFGGTGSVSGFKVERSPDGAGDWAQVGQINRDQRVFTDYPPECGKTYHYRVASYNDKFTSQWSGAAMAETRACNLPLIEVNQEVGLTYGRHVAGKDAAIIVYLKDPVEVNEATQTVKIQRDGAEVATLTPKSAPGLSEKLIFLCKDGPTCGNWQEGTYTFTADINGNASTLSNVKFQKRRPLRALVVPLKVNYAGQIKEVTDPKWREPSPLLKKLFPVAPDDFVWDVREAQLDLTDIDLTTFGGRMQAYRKLEGLQDDACNTRAAVKPDNCYDSVVGIRPTDEQLPANQRLSPGQAMNGSIITLPGEVVVHELGHTLGLGDEYDAYPRSNPSGSFNCTANPPPSNYLGRPEKSGGPALQCADSTTEGYYGNQSPPYGYGVLIPSDAHAFDVSKGGFLDERHMNLMGNSGPRWIHPHTRRYLFDRQALAADGAAGGGAVLAQTGDGDARRGATDGAAQSLNATEVMTYTAIALDGLINTSGEVSILSTTVYSTTEHFPAADPDDFGLAVREIGTFDETMAVHSIPVQFEMEDGVAVGDEGYFSESIPLSDAVTALEIIRGDTVLRRIPLTDNTITLELTAPAAGGALDGEQTIGWTADSANGAPLSYRVDYAIGPPADEGGDAEWIQLADDLTATEWTQDFDDLPGSLADPAGDGLSRIRITATDGVNAVSVVSEGNPVAPKPPLVFIDAQTVDDSLLDDIGGPGDVTAPAAQRRPFTYFLGEPVVLQGSAYDPQDGPLADSDLSWNLATAEATLGYGEVFVLEDLEAGDHAVRFTGLNSVKLEASDTVTVTVLDPDGLVVTTINPLAGDDVSPTEALAVSSKRFIEISGSTVSSNPSVVQIVDVTWRNSSRASGGVNWLPPTVAGDPTDWTIPGLYLETGLNQLWITTTDSLGRELTEQVSIFFDASGEPEPVWEKGYVDGREVEYQVVDGQALFEGHGGGFMNLGDPAQIPDAPGMPLSESSDASAHDHDGVAGTHDHDGAGAAHSDSHSHVADEAAGTDRAMAPDGGGVSSDKSLWAEVGGVAMVPYTIDPGTKPGTVKNINDAVTAFNNQLDGVIRWVPRTGQANYVLFQFDGDPGSCWSAVGKNYDPGEQKIGGDPDCSTGVIVHEMGHAVGIWHEQSRNDRDNYMTLKPENMTASDLTQWEKYTASGIDLGPYDFGSVMHYGRGFGRAGLFPTFVTIPPGLHIGFPNSPTKYLSDGDLDSLRRLYGKPSSKTTVTTNPPGLKVTIDQVEYTTPQTFDWAIGAQHTLSVRADAQKLGDGYFIFGRWSNQMGPAGPFNAEVTITVTAGDGSRTSPSSAPAQTVQVAHFRPLYPITTSVEPDGAGRVIIDPLPQSYAGADPKQLYLLADSPVSFTAEPAGDYSFAKWENAGEEALGANPKPHHVLGPLDPRAVFTKAAVTTIKADPEGLGVKIKVDNNDVIPPASFVWNPGDTHNVDVDSPQPNDKEPTRYEWQSWSDGQPKAHSIKAGNTSQTLTARFVTKHKIVVESVPNTPPGCAGTVAFSPSDTFVKAGTTVNFTANAAPGWNFTGWTKGLSGSANPDSLTIDRDVVVQASFNNGSTDNLTVTSLEPSFVIAGAGKTAFVVRGTGFTAKSTGEVDRGDYMTSPDDFKFISDTEIQLAVRPEELAKEGKIRLRIYNQDAPDSSCKTSADGELTIRPKPAGVVNTPTRTRTPVPGATTAVPPPTATRTRTPTPVPGATTAVPPPTATTGRYYINLPHLSLMYERP